MEGWKDGKMERWKDGRMERWKDGKMEGWKKGKMEEETERWKECGSGHKEVGFPEIIDMMRRLGNE